MTVGGRHLFLFRHAKSAWDQPLPDHDRPLAARGIRDATAAGRLLRDRGWRPALVLCSTAVRARQTWDRAVTGGAEAGEIRYTDRIYQATAEELLELIGEVPAATASLMLIGHGPGLPELADRLSGGIGGKYRTSGLAVFACPGPWTSVRSARLLAFETPRG